MTQTVFLIRHGAVIGDGAQRFIGRTDLPMSEAGEDQVRALAAKLMRHPLDVIYCCNLARSLRTAQLIASGRQVQIRISPLLAEIDMGLWEGLSRREVAETQPEAYAARGRDFATFRPPCGESFADLADRVLPLWRSIVASPDEAVAMAGHAGVNRVILCDVLGMPLSNVFRLSQEPASVTVVRFGRSGPVVHFSDTLESAFASAAEHRSNATRVAR